MNVSIRQSIAIVVFAGLAVLATRNLGRLSRGTGLRPGSQPDWWARGLPVGVVTGWAMLVGALLTILTLSVHARRRRSSAFCSPSSWWPSSACPRSG